MNQNSCLRWSDEVVNQQSQRGFGVEWFLRVNLQNGVSLWFMGVGIIHVYHGQIFLPSSQIADSVLLHQQKNFRFLVNCIQ